MCVNQILDNIVGACEGNGSAHLFCINTSALRASRWGAQVALRQISRRSAPQSVCVSWATRVRFWPPEVLRSVHAVRPTLQWKCIFLVCVHTYFGVEERASWPLHALKRDGQASASDLRRKRFEEDCTPQSAASELNALQGLTRKKAIIISRVCDKKKSEPKTAVLFFLSYKISPKNIVTKYSWY